MPRMEVAPTPWVANQALEPFLSSRNPARGSRSAPASTSGPHLAPGERSLWRRKTHQSARRQPPVPTSLRASVASGAAKRINPLAGRSASSQVQGRNQVTGRRTRRRRRALSHGSRQRSAPPPRASPPRCSSWTCSPLHEMVTATSGSANSVRRYYDVYRVLANLDVLSGSSCSPARR